MQQTNPLYKNREWLYYQIIELGKTPKQVAEEYGYSIHQIHDWSQKRFHLNAKKRAWGIHLSETQKQVVVGSLLGDGHISKSGRYVECHCAKQKDYLEWKLSVLNNLFSYGYVPVFKNSGGVKIICGVECRAQDSYAISGLCNEELLTLSRLSKVELINLLEPLGFSVFCLDDGCNHYYQGVRKSHSQWTLGTCSFSETEAEHLVSVIKNKFGLDCIWEYSKDHEKTDIRVRFRNKESEQLNELIKQNIPNNLQILKDKHIIL